MVSAYCRESKKVVRLSVGSRSYNTLNRVLISLQLSECKKIYTDKLKHYRYLIEKKMHSTKPRATNHLERMHLNLRTHLKRLNRRSIGFSRSLLMLTVLILVIAYKNFL
ncbi:IS1 family transposase [Flavobacteriaceae bacterium]|nr:IS1 family transposase [Flavobacteriaceae bacterium]